MHPKYLYDQKGSEIFEKICELEEYYPTRSENQILIRNVKEIATLIGENALIIEPGSGSGKKIRSLLANLKDPAGYVPVEISEVMLRKMASDLCRERPDLKVVPVCADFTEDLRLPPEVSEINGKRVIFFPGSTIGNFTPNEAVEFLKTFTKIAGPRGGLLIGADLKKEREVLERAYDDSEGVTAAFNLNLLERLNREASASFDSKKNFHRAVYNQHLGRVEMHLVSKVAQLIRVNQTVFRFHEGESIHTESSYKYSIEDFRNLCVKAKLRLKKSWQDANGLFSVYYLERD